MWGLFLYTIPHTLFRKRYAPSTPFSDHSRSFSGGAAKREKSRAVSAPYLLMRWSGSTTFFFDLDIFSTLPLNTGLPHWRHFSSFISEGKIQPCSGHFSVS